MLSPSRSPNLEQLRKQAKDLLRACRAGGPHVLARLAAHLPRRAEPEPRLEQIRAHDWRMPCW